MSGNVTVAASSLGWGSPTTALDGSSSTTCAPRAVWVSGVRVRRTTSSCSAQQPTSRRPSMAAAGDRCCSSGSSVRSASAERAAWKRIARLPRLLRAYRAPRGHVAARLADRHAGASRRLVDHHHGLARAGLVRPPCDRAHALAATCATWRRAGRAPGGPVSRASGSPGRSWADTTSALDRSPRPYPGPAPLQGPPTRRVPLSVLRPRRSRGWCRAPCRPRHFSRGRRRDERGQPYDCVRFMQPRQGDARCASLLIKNRTQSCLGYQQPVPELCSNWARTICGGRTILIVFVAIRCWGG